MSEAPAPVPRIRNGWVFSPSLDLAAFLGPLLLAGALILWADRTGRLHDEVPPWAFFAFRTRVAEPDGPAHVYGTLFRAYLDPGERRRRPGLLLGVPLGCLAVGTLLYAQDGAWFWRALAYVASFHFVRQTWGWMSYSARRTGESDPLDRALDRAAVYASTLWPLLWWHAHLPRPFVWFVDGDFVAGLPGVVADVGLVAHVAILLAWIARQAVRLATGRPVNLAKALVLASTWLAWVGGIVLLRSDLAFTATNVLAHGIPYAILVHRVGAQRLRDAPPRLARLFRPSGAVAFGAILVALGYLEETLWDGLVWHQHAELFPIPAVDLPEALVGFVVPLLAVPQATHYVLDAFLWRPSRDRSLREALGLPASATSAGS